MNGLVTTLALRLDCQQLLTVKTILLQNILQLFSLDHFMCFFWRLQSKRRRLLHTPKTFPKLVASWILPYTFIDTASYIALNEKIDVTTVLGCTNQQPPQRGGAVPDPVWVGLKWLLASPRTIFSLCCPLNDYRRAAHSFSKIGRLSSPFSCLFHAPLCLLILLLL